MKSALKVITLIIGLLVALAVVGAIVAVSLGYAYGGLKQPAQKVVLQTTACTEADIKKYNEFVTTFPSDDAQRDAKVASMKDFVAGLKEKAGFSDDATCQFIAYATAAGAADASAAQVALDAVTSLSAKGSFPSNQLLDVVSIDSMKSRVEALKNPNPASNPLGSG